MESADLKIVILSRITFSDEEICGLGVSGHPSASMVIDDIYGPYDLIRFRRQPKLVLDLLKLSLPAEMYPLTGSFDVGCQRCTCDCEILRLIRQMMMKIFFKDRTKLMFRKLFY